MLALYTSLPGKTTLAVSMLLPDAKWQPLVQKMGTHIAKKHFYQIVGQTIGGQRFLSNFDPGGMAERSIAAVLKTVDCYRSGGSNPSPSAEK